MGAGVSRHDKPGRIAAVPLKNPLARNDGTEHRPPSEARSLIIPTAFELPLDLFRRPIECLVGLKL